MHAVMMSIAPFLVYAIPVLFLGVVAWVYRPAAREAFRQASLIPVRNEAAGRRRR